MKRDALTPNVNIDRAVDKLLKGIDEHPSDIQIKIINSAVAWEKVKFSIKDQEDAFDPDEM